MADAHPTQDAGKYYIPHGSKWPIVGSVSLFVTMLGVASWLNGVDMGPWIFLAGLAAVAYMFYGWFGTVIGESQAGLYNAGVDKSFRMGMMWFIFSEVMFFAAFFGALYYARQLSVPWLGGEGTKFLTNVILWKDFTPSWPTNGPQAVGGAFETIPAFGTSLRNSLPAVNTAILLTSGVTITIAHHALRAGNRNVLKVFLAATFLLGFLFVFLQATEYHHAYTELNLTLGSGVYGSTFFMLTGFHGLHVTIGAIMLTVIWLRTMKGHFTPQHHFAFEGVAWYWHFVDVVWLGLFIFVYWL
jgi:cytochrome c oxidase subunit 3